MTHEPCRRRPIFAARGSAVPEAAAAGGPEPPAPEPKRRAPKGTCPYCGRHIGRGVNSHAKRCKVKRAQT